MEVLRRYFSWLTHPQFIVGFITICLCLSAAGSILRAAQPTTLSIHARPGRLSAIPPSRLSCDVKPCLALTFDDGPNAAVTPQILDILSRQQVRATFFVIGVHVPGQEALLRREYYDGHEIGNHSWNHPDLTKLSPEDAQTQIEATQRVIAGAGVPAPKILRPPYGAVNDMVMAHNNLTIVRWNVDPEDWRIQDPAKINQSLMAHVRPGAIILMHDIYPSTVAALEPALQTLKQSYQFVTVSQLLDITPGDQGQFFARYK